MMFLKVHHITSGDSVTARRPVTHTPGTGDVVAVCDRNLINTTLRDGDIEVHISDGFYGTVEADEGAVREALKYAANINLMGKNAVSIAVDMRLIDAACCTMIRDVPHATIYRV